ncbi:aspartyl-tRNA synthetase [Streptococcus pseudopneumoniae]|nr:aspartyl-tRNA synthetase [Streptococcus pseudopneumoniae]
MKIKEQTRKLTAGCSKHCFEVADRTPYLRQGEADVV